MYADDREVVMSTVDSILVWGRKSKAFKGEFGPDIKGIPTKLYTYVVLHYRMLVDTDGCNQKRIVLLNCHGLFAFTSWE